MTIKGDRSRVKNHEAYRATVDRIFNDRIRQVQEAEEEHGKNRISSSDHGDTTGGEDKGDQEDVG